MGDMIQIILKKKNAPIFAYFGAEGSLDIEAPDPFLIQNAPRFKALVVYIEHRFYGQSNPLGSIEESLKNESIRGYFNSAQALEDFAEILLYIKSNLSAHDSPVIVMGGSYGGMLASWFRLKYPHLAVGAFASSAPILYFDNITPQDGFFSVVSKDFKETSEICYLTIKRSWKVIDKVAARPNGLSILSQKFNTCVPLKSPDELKNFLKSFYVIAAQYNYPSISKICGAIDGLSRKDGILEKIIAGLNVERRPPSCIKTITKFDSGSLGWFWQICTEMLMPIGISNDHGMFPRSPFDLDDYITECKNQFGALTPRPGPHWITTYYGGHNINLALKRFGSNIIFSNGLRDPFSSGGVLHNISDSVVAITTRYGHHCMDLGFVNDDDPIWLRKQRKKEVKIMKSWLKNYYVDLYAESKSSYV